LLIGVAFLVSCETTGSVEIIHDLSVPVEQTALISCSGTATIVGYNGMAVNWTQPWAKGPGKLIQIPAGNTTLEWNMEAVKRHLFRAFL